MTRSAPRASNGPNHLAVTTERLRLNRGVDLAALAEYLKSKGLEHTEMTAGKDGERVGRYHWTEPAAGRWMGRPPSVDLTVRLRS